MKWKTKKDKPELNRKILMLTETGVSMRTFTDSIPFRTLMMNCVKWEYVDEIINFLNEQEKE